jgi:hypothetical protein
MKNQIKTIALLGSLTAIARARDIRARRPAMIGRW